MAEEATETEIFELLAFELYASSLSQTEEDAASRIAGCMREWRDNEPLRKRWRELAADFLKTVETHGMLLKPRKPQLIRRRLDEIITIPARKAYVLNLESGVQ